MIRAIFPKDPKSQKIIDTFVRNAFFEPEFSINLRYSDCSASSPFMVGLNSFFRSSCTLAHCLRTVLGLLPLELTSLCLALRVEVSDIFESIRQCFWEISISWLSAIICSSNIISHHDSLDDSYMIFMYL